MSRAAGRGLWAKGTARPKAQRWEGARLAAGQARRGPGAQGAREVVEAQPGAGGGQTVPCGGVRGRRGGLSDVRQDLTDVFKTTSVACGGRASLGTGPRRSLQCPGEEWLGAGPWPCRSRRDKLLCPIGRPSDPSPQGGRELPEAWHSPAVPGQLLGDTARPARPPTGLRQDGVWGSSACSSRCGGRSAPSVSEV